MMKRVHHAVVYLFLLVVIQQQKQQQQYSTVNSLLLISSLPPPSSSSSFQQFSSTSGSSSKCTIEICQNKHCCKHWKGMISLPETVSDLVSSISCSGMTDTTSTATTTSSIEIVTTSCLSQCDKGPNMNIILVQQDKDSSSSSSSPNTSRQSQVINGVADATTVAVVLESVIPFIIGTTTISPKHMAAISCIEKSIRENNIFEKERYLSSVIRALDNDEHLKFSTTNARARVLRGEIYFEQCQYDNALADVVVAVTIFQEQQKQEQLLSRPIILVSTNSLGNVVQSQAFRLQSQIYLHLEQYENAIESLQQACVVNPSMKNKFINDIKAIMNNQKANHKL